MQEAGLFCAAMSPGNDPDNAAGKPAKARRQILPLFGKRETPAAFSVFRTIIREDSCGRCPPCRDGNVWFTAGKDGSTLYAIYTLRDGETLPDAVTWTGNLPRGKMKLLAGNKTLKYTCKDNQVCVTLPKGLKDEPLAIRFTRKE